MLRHAASEAPGPCLHQLLEPRILLSGEGPDWTHLSSNTGDLTESLLAGDQQTASLVLDIDRDGVNDFVITERTEAPSVVWYRRAADGWDELLVDNTYLRIEAGGACSDIDGDGDLDIVFGGDAGSNDIWWWENPYPNYSATVPWPRHVIKDSGSNKHHDQIMGDFDGDGDDELVTWNQGAGGLFFAEIPADPRTATSWNLVKVFSGSSSCEGLAAADINLDGVMDVVGAGYWFEHVSGSSFTAHAIDATQAFTRSAAGQLIAGGRPEVIFVPGDADGPMVMYAWTGAAWSKSTLIANVRHGHSLTLGDVNLDGKLDIFTAEMYSPGPGSDARCRVLFGDGAGQFTEQTISIGIGNHESRLADLDGDGDLDILTKPYTWDAPRVDVWINEIPHKLQLDQWDRQVIDDARPWRSLFIDAADLDGDGDRDMVTGGWWYENPGDSGGAWTRHTVGSPLNNMAAVYDFDDDGDYDILGTGGQGSAANDSFVWARNDGAGSFAILDNIASGDGDFLQGVAVDRFSEGGPVEVALSWHAAGKGVQMLTVPADPSTQNWTWRRISTVSQDEALSRGDIDRDGDVDLLLGTQWLRNDGTNWTALTLNPAAGLPDRNRLVDLNGDGRLDALVGYEAISVPGKLAWYEQPESVGDTWVEHVIASTVIGPMSLDAADLDGDGDVDMVVGEHNLADPSQARLWLFENVDGDGSAWNPILIYTGDEHHDGAVLRDVDGDGDSDVLSIGWSHSRVLLYENTARPIATGNVAPTVTIAGPADSPVYMLDADSALALDAEVADANNPEDVTLAWSVTSKPIDGYAVFDDPQAADTLVRFLGAEGRYVLRLTADDGEAQAYREITAVIGPVDTPVAPDPDVAWWRFDETGGSTAADSIGAHAAAVSGAAWSTQGIDGGCLDFDGVNDAVYLGGVDVSGSALTLAAWIRADDFGVYDARIISKADGVYDDDHWWMLSTIGDGTGLRFRLKTNGATSTLISGNGVISSGAWHHVAARYDGAAMSLYVDGEQVASMAKTGTVSVDATVSAAVGNNPAGVGERPFDGLIDDVRIYGVALGNDELSALAGGGPPNTAPRVSTGPDATVDGLTAVLQGTLVDDGLPVPPASTSHWTLVSGPAQAVFGDAYSPITSVSVGEYGSYTFRLTGDDGEVETASEVIITFRNPAWPSADFNGDGVVDIIDFVILKQNYGSSQATASTGDANADGLVDIQDFVLLKQQYG